MELNNRDTFDTVHPINPVALNPSVIHYRRFCAITSSFTG